MASVTPQYSQMWPISPPSPLDFDWTRPSKRLILIARWIRLTFKSSIWVWFQSFSPWWCWDRRILLLPVSWHPSPPRPIPLLKTHKGCPATSSPCGLRPPGLTSPQVVFSPEDWGRVPAFSLGPGAARETPTCAPCDNPSPGREPKLACLGCTSAEQIVPSCLWPRSSYQASNPGLPSLSLYQWAWKGDAWEAEVGAALLSLPCPAWPTGGVRDLGLGWGVG